MKKIFKLILAVLLTTSLTGCFKQNNSTSSDLLDKVLKDKKITVATEGTWSPWTYHDENGDLVGFDVEIARYIGQELGVEVEFIEGEWDGLLAGVSAGRYDMIINGVSATEERKQSYNFTDSYAYDIVALVVMNDNDEITSFEDLNGKTTGNTITSSYAKIAEQYGAIVYGVDNLSQTFELLKSGRIDATLNSQVTVVDYFNSIDSNDMKIVATSVVDGDLAIALKKDDSTLTLIEKMNEILAKMRSEGILSELSNTYFQTDITNK